MPSTRGLQSRFAPWARALLRALGSGYRITSGRRSFGEQQALYERWRRGDPGIYTPAPPGHSQHEKGWAVDLAHPGRPPKEDERLFTLGYEWRSLGGVWGGPSDPVHFEAPRSWTGRSS